MAERLLPAMELGRFLTAFLWGRSRQRHVVLSLQLGFTGGPGSEAVFVQIVAGPAMQSATRSRRSTGSISVDSRRKNTGSNPEGDSAYRRVTPARDLPAPRALGFGVG